MYRIKAILFFIRFYPTLAGNPLANLSRAYRHTQTYAYHLSLRQQTTKLNLAIIKKHERVEQSRHLQYYKNTIKQYLQSKKRVVENKAEEFSREQVKQSVIKALIRGAFEKLSLFYQSLQSLVEGRREVLQNEQFIFDDGASVKQKRDEFQKTLEKLFGKAQGTAQSQKQDQKQ